MKVAIYMYIGKHLGGAERRLIRIFSNMPDNIQAEILILEGKEKKARELIASFITDRARVRVFSDIWSLIWYMVQNRFNWIVGFTPGGRFILLSFFAWLFRIKRLFLSVQTSSSGLIFDKSLFQRLNIVKFLLCVRLASVIDCLYPSALPRLQKKFPSKHIEVTSNSFTDLEKFKPTDLKCKYIVFASTLIPIKNTDLFIRAISIIQNKVRDLQYKCFICGDGPLLPSLQKIVDDTRCSDIIEFTGRIKMEEILPQTKIFCSLQSINNYPSQSLIEAISCGCFCIATDCGDTSKLVKRNFGKLVQFDARAIADALSEAMLFDCNHWDDIMKRARNFAEINCNIKTSVDYYTNIFKY